MVWPIPLAQHLPDVLYDDRRDISPGEKLAESDLIGVPTRLVISKKTTKAKKVEIKKRGSKNSKLINMTQIKKILNL